ncbi:Mu transposase C-terminal domain-containing protein [Planctobacterium marinum]|uniref:Mu transposase C-terminal domain-containing protein n=1 Tax=Planctobacterium marinum TaxID=1631968 RepID=UPI001E5C84DE|nr:Mu transposase C-terminal domain-containing protein [Planctobacterium marinum]MCC2605612.1 Mu transposase C-terminal domain-containing protein [Planctobacterium marinum]
MTPSKSLQLTPGSEVVFQNKNYRIKLVVDLNQVVLLNPVNNETVTAAISELSAPIAIHKPKQDLELIDDKAWQTAQKRLEIIKPLIGKLSRTRAEVSEIAEANDVSTNTVYGWLKLYEDSQLLTSLMPKIRKDKGVTKLTAAQEEIIKEVIEAEYLSKQKKTKKKVCDEVKKKCIEQGVTPPHKNTVRNRISSLSDEIVAARRLGRKIADNDFKPIEGEFPGADIPLAVVQIDHTKLDIILVDDHFRRPVGRPWITLAFDVFSRMVTGFYVSFDPPGALSTGLCLAHSILPKDSWLIKHGVKGDWPLWGLPAKVHVDNAKEFRGNMLQKACDQYGIDLEWRPVARPNFGAHVERALGTFSKEIHMLPGTTFSNPRDKGEYDSEGKAALTLSEFESWLATYIVDVYHQKVHSMIKMTPMTKYRKGIFGDSERPGSGLPPKIADEEKLKLDLMPYELRTIQDYGVRIDEIFYYSDVLRRWINAKNPDDPNKKRKFMFRRDPRDISQVWFYDPELHRYFEISYRDTSHPAISIWELREAKKRLEDEGRSVVDEAAIFDAYDRMREIEEEAISKSKSARRAV